jgi:hypothetical protein
MKNPPAPANNLSGPYKTYVSSVGSTFSYSNGSVTKYAREKYSVKTPGFRSLKPSQYPWNPYSQREYEESYRGSGQVLITYSGGSFERSTGYVYNKVPILSLPWPDKVSHVDQVAKSRLLAKLKDGSVNLAQAFAERRQAADMIARNVNRLASAVMAVRHGNFRHASNLFGIKYRPQSFKQRRDNWEQNLSNYWLEFQYGWKPLVSDIYGACELLANTYHRNRPIRVSASYSGVGTYNKDLISRVDYGSDGTIDERLNGKAERQVRYIVEFQLDSQIAALLSSTGITDPALLAWELLPYSFVVDWFIPVGNYLSQLTADRGLLFSRGVKSVKTQYELYTNVSSTTPWYKGYYSVEKDPGRERIFSLQKDRTVLTSFPAPSFPEPIPYLSINRALSGAALLTQAFGRRTGQLVYFKPMR